MTLPFQVTLQYEVEESQVWLLFFAVCVLGGIVFGVQLQRRFLGRLQRWWQGGVVGNVEEVEEEAQAYQNYEHLFDAGRGRSLPPPESSTGKKYYALAAREKGRLGVYSGYSLFRHEIGQTSGCRGAFIACESLEEAIAFVARRNPEQNQVKVYL